jgi:dolichyl-phosphate-mannose-protein mannosyltransferase
MRYRCSRKGWLAGEGWFEADTRTTQTSSFIDTLDEYEFLIAPIVFTALAFFTRMWKIGLSPIVTWDEAQ